MDVLLDRRLAADRYAPRLAREQVRQALAQRLGVVGLDAVVLVLSELVTNVSLHVGGWVHMRVVELPETIRLEVTDSSRRLPLTRRSLQRSEVSGRGLPLITAMSRAWGAEATDNGKRVWVELDASLAPAVPIAASPHDRQSIDD